MIRLRTTFTDISADLMYDVLHDPVYRKVSMQFTQNPESTRSRRDVIFFILFLWNT